MAANPNPQTGPRTEGFRFAHVTGARPLEGFTIKRGIGVGGFGEVYYALSDAGKEVALKRIQRHLDIELRGVRQCLNLKHQNLLSLFDIRYDERGEAWVVMEYILGESLRDVLERHPNGLSTAEVQRWFVGVASGVACLHENGIVHRDLKPGNIFEDQGVVKLGDYGLSKFISCSRRSGQTESVGTFHYMAPEIGRGSYGKEIDVYALGIILYELLTGKVPYEGESSQEIIMKHLTADPDLSVVPVEFREPIRRALLKDPERRYRSVGEMLAALRWAPVVMGGGGASPHAASRDGFSNDRETLYIGEDSKEIVFGPVRDVVDAQVVPSDLRGHSARRAGSSSSAAFWEREPIAMAVRVAMRRGLTWWQQSSLGLPIKIVLLVIAGFIALSNSHWIIPISVMLGMLYLVYFGIWAIVTPSESQAAARQAVGPTGAAISGVTNLPMRKSKARPKGIEVLRPLLAMRSGTERTAEILGSLLLSFGVSAVLCLIALLIGGKELDRSLHTWTLYAWMLGGATALSWSVLTLGKFWETRTGDATHRRFIMLVVGLLLGLAGFAANQFLGEPLRAARTVNPDATLTQIYAGSQPLVLYAGSQPLVSAWLVHCGILCLGLRWWRQADPLRSTRLSLWSVAVCGFAAGLLQQVLPLYQPWLVLTGIVAAIAIQLAAPWVHPQQRERMRESLTVT